MNAIKPLLVSVALFAGVTGSAHAQARFAASSGLRTWAPSGSQNGGYLVNSYTYDDGQSENALGLIGCSVPTLTKLVWIQRFDAVAGADVIDTISTCFGTAISGGNAPPSGTRAGVAIYADDLQDGDPNTSRLLVQASTTVQNGDTDIFNDVAIPPTSVVGTFFVAAWCDSMCGGPGGGPSEFPAPLDTNQASLGRAWVAAADPASTFDPSALSALSFPPTDVDSLGFPGVWMLRARSASNTCPGNVITNGDFTNGFVPGSMGSGGAVSNWSALTATPQVVTDGCDGPGSIMMWGNQVVGESIQQSLGLNAIHAGRTYRVSVCYRWMDNNPLLPQYVRFRLAASGGAPTGYPALSTTSDLVGVTPNTSSTAWTTFTFPNWTAPNNASWLTVNPENDSSVSSGDFVSWGSIDSICIAECCPYNVVTNGDFTDGVVPGSMGSGGAVANWTALTATPQVITDGCDAPGSLMMWGNQVVGESVAQQLSGTGIHAGQTYRVKVCYRWVDNNPILPQFVRFRLCASSVAPAGYPATTPNSASFESIGVTPDTASTGWHTYTFPDWTAQNDSAWITVNPENDSVVYDGNFVSWGVIDDICISPVTPPIAVTYCTCKLNSLGCCARIGYAGLPSVSLSAGFTIYCTNGRNNKLAQLAYSVTGPDNKPFVGGTLCIRGHCVHFLNFTFCTNGGYLTPSVNGAGSPSGNDCSGVPAIDFNAYSASLLGGNPRPELMFPGTEVWCQWILRDPGNSFKLALSDALTFTRLP